MIARRSRVIAAAAIAAITAILATAPLAPAASQEPTLYQLALYQLAAEDTLGALASLRELTRTQRNFAPGWGLLGRILTAKASGVATDFRERREAEKALRQALELDFDNPLYLFALGQLKRKQQMHLDSRRVLNRAIKLMEKSPEGLSPAEQAALWFQRGLFEEDEYLDTRHLVYAPNVPVQSLDCAGVGTFCLNFTRPKRFNEHFKHAADLSHFGEDDYERMVRAFRKSLEADPTHNGAFRRLAIHLIDRGEYREALRLARQYRDDGPQSPWGYITLGLIHRRMGKDSLAGAEFDRGLGLALPSIAAHYREVSHLLKKPLANKYKAANDLVRERLEEVLWRKSDPLYLTSVNEIRVAHLARVAYADLMYEDPSEGLWGSETEQGAIYVRYGPPERIWQLHRDASRELSEIDVSDALAGGGGGRSRTSNKGGGRWIFWNYAWDLPNFIFQKQLRYRHSSHVLGSYSKVAEEEARAVAPAVYDANFEILDYPTQLARFRGAADSIVEVDLYSEVPSDRLLAGVSGDSLELGLFLFAGAEHVQVFARRLSVAAQPKRQAVTYSIPLLGGRYTYSLEARAPSGTAAVRREQIEVEPFRDGRLALSDLLLADAVTPLTREPADRRGFALKVNRRLEFEADEPLAIYWEVYGLTPDADGFAHYQVTLSLTDIEGGGVAAKVVAALGRLFGRSGDEDLELTFERTVELVGDRVPEYLSLELAVDEPGEYQVRVKVTDQVSGEALGAERNFRLTGR